MIKSTDIEKEVLKILKSKALDYPFPEGEWQGHEYYDNVTSLISNSGLWLEFGVWSGRTINYFSKKTQNKIYGFDSFMGLPEGDGHWKKGSFNVDGKLPEVSENVELTVGLFQETLGGFLKEHKEPVSFLHIGCDIYSSSKFILDMLKDRIVSGTVISFDEIYNYPGFENHEILSWLEFIEEVNLNYEWICRSIKSDDEFVTGVQATCVIK